MLTVGRERNNVACIPYAADALNCYKIIKMTNRGLESGGWMLCFPLSMWDMKIFLIDGHTECDIDSIVSNCGD